MWELGKPIPGFGSDVTGGAGGDIYTVTSGADDGPGTLRAAVGAIGSRVIKFDPTVRDIQLASPLNIYNGNLTIDGHTAGGVQVRNHTVAVRASNVLLAGLKVRPGDQGGAGADTRDGILISGSNPISDISVVHCNAQWGIDENFQIYGDVKRVSVYRCWIAEGLANSLHSKGMHSMGLMTSGGSSAGYPEFVSIIENGFLFNNRRNPALFGGGKIEVINNFCFGAGTSMVFTNAGRAGAGEVFVGHNHYRLGPEYAGTAGHDGHFIVDGDGTYYIVGNRFEDVNGDPYSEPHNSGGGATVHTNAPAWASGAHTSLNDWRHQATNDWGAYPLLRDAADDRIRQQVIEGVGGLVDTMSSAARNDGQWPAQLPHEPPAEPPAPDLEARMAALEAEVTGLSAALADAHARIDAIKAGLEQAAG